MKLFRNRRPEPGTADDPTTGQARRAEPAPVLVVPEIVIHNIEESESFSESCKNSPPSSESSSKTRDIEGSSSLTASVQPSLSSNNMLAPPSVWDKRRMSVSTLRSSITSMMDLTLARARGSTYTGLVLAMSSGIIFAMYGAMLANIKKDVNRNTVLTLRGVIQIVLMGLALYLSRKNRQQQVPSAGQPKSHGAAAATRPEKRRSSGSIKANNDAEKVNTAGEASDPFIRSTKDQGLDGDEDVERRSDRTPLPERPIPVGQGFWDANKYRALMVVCSLVGGARISALFAALQMIPLTSVYTILNSSPVIVMILSHFLLNDPLTVLRILCCSGFVGGVVLVFSPDSDGVGQEDSENWYGYLVAVNALLFSALGTVLNKKLTKRYSKYAINFGLGISIFAVGLGQFLAVKSEAPTFPTTAKVWTLSIIVGVLGTLQQFLLVWALELDSSSRVAMARSVQILTSFFAQLSAGQDFTFEQIAGALIVMATISVNSWEKRIVERCPKVGLQCPKCWPSDGCCRGDQPQRHPAANPVAVGLADATTAPETQ